MRRRLFCGLLYTIALASWANLAQAVEVQVGYADNIRPSPFFPNPWDGDPNTIFAGAANGGQFDTGAIRIINNTASPITFNSLVVDQFGDGAVFNIWGSFANTVIPVGWSMIFAQTAGFNFDSSDDFGSQNGGAAATPRVTLGLDGQTPVALIDTAQVLNTEGSDHLAAANLNESHQWRDIGTFGGQAGIPEPSTLVIWSLLGALVVAGRRYCRRTPA